MKKIAVFTITVVILGLAGCSDTRILPSEITGTVFYYQADGEENIFSIEFDNNTSGTLRELSPHPVFDPTLSVSELLDLDPPIDKDDPVNFTEVDNDPFTISGLSGTRHLTGGTFSSDTGITTWKVWLYTFRNYGYSNFLNTLTYTLQ